MEQLIFTPRSGPSYGRRPPDMVGQRFEVLHDGGEMEFVACAGKTSQAHPLEAVMGLHVREAHLAALLAGSPHVLVRRHLHKLKEN